MKQILVLISITAFLFGPSLELQARGRGGGGRGGGGGISRGGGSRGGGGNFSRPASRPSTPSFNRPSSRPSTPSRPAITPGTRPSITPGNRPSIKPGDRPTTLPENRPATGDRPNLKPGDRPSTLPGTRPGIGDSPSTLPGTRPGIENRPGAGNRPSTLPGLGAGVGIGAGISNRPSRPGLGDKRDRPTTLPNRPNHDDRRDQLNDRLKDRDNIHIGDNNINIGNNNHWDNNWHDRNWQHNHWHHGHWHGGFHGGGYWGRYWWDRYPVMTAIGVTTWAVNRCAWATGYYNYSNPYYVNQSTTVYNYSQPIQVIESYPETADDGTTPAPDVSQKGLDFFDRSMKEFYAGEYDKSLASTNSALKEIPNDTAIHEFRALVLFALGKYDESAATLYAVLSVGPGWDWTTMSSLYPSVDVYTKQLRSLEEYRDQHPTETAPRFVLAYQYMTADHSEAAAEQLKRIVELNPKDDLSRTLLLTIDPDADIPKPEVIEPPKPTSAIQDSQLAGNWNAKRGGDTFGMDLQANGDFTWSYKPSSGDSSTVKGVWAIDDDGILALDMGEEDVMLAQVILNGSKLDFYMLGDTQGEEPLKFTK